MRNAVVLQHVGFEDLGSLAPVLRTAGFQVKTLQAGVDDLRHLDAAHLLIVLGGPISAYDEKAYPFLVEERNRITGRIQAGKPILGICLGAQLMAAALGARVYPGENGKEIGWSPLLGRGDVSPHSLAELLTPDIKVLHWHGDTFEIPVGATHLAASGTYESQAFALDRFGLALQFHAEVRAQDMERWFIGHCCELATAGIDVPQLRAESRAQAFKLEAAAKVFWEHWLAGLSD